MIPANLVTNWLLSLFCPFVENQKPESSFHQVGDPVTRNISVFFVYSELRPTPKVCRIQ